jgi:thiamine pyrophosphate-dependent acetolactate synthase large subunit-like protein
MFGKSTSSEPPVLGGEQIAQFVKDHGYRHIFALPGSSMTAATYSFQKSGAEYVPAIHESVTVAMADGYARVAGSSFSMLYMLPGVANALGNLYNAWKDETPMVVLASQQGTRLRSPMDWTICEGDLVGMTRPYTRLSHELAPDMPLRPWLDQARQVSLGPIPGPTFLALQENVIEEPQPVERGRISVRPSLAVPDLSAIAQALRTAERPLIIVGGQLARHGGARAIERLSTNEAIPMAYEGGFSDRLGAAPGHPNMLGNIIGRAAPMEQDADVVLAIGCRFMAESHVRPKPWFPSARFIAHLNGDPTKLEASQSVDFAAACDTGAAAAALADMLEANPASAELKEARSQRLAAHRNQIGVGYMGMIPSTLEAVEPLRDALDHGWVVDESVSGLFALQDRLTATDGSRYIGTSGSSLGWGTGAAVGVALASGEPVTLVIGDGSLRFSALGLWNIATSNLPVTIVVLDNGGYGSTRMFERFHALKHGAEGGVQSVGYLGSDLRTMGPSVKSIIEGFGIPCMTPKPGDDMRAAMMTAWEKGRSGPIAIVLPVDFNG